MKGMAWFIFFLLLLAGVYWFYGKYFKTVTDRTTSVVQQTGTAEAVKPASTSTTETKTDTTTSKRSGESMRNTKIGQKINDIYSKHNKALENN
jgi:cytoskeletal protein RodZ